MTARGGDLPLQNYVTSGRGGYRPTPSESRNGGTVTYRLWQRNETLGRDHEPDADENYMLLWKLNILGFCYFSQIPSPSPVLLWRRAGVTLTGDTCTRVIFSVHCTRINLCGSNFPLLVEQRSQKKKTSLQRYYFLPHLVKTVFENLPAKKLTRILGIRLLCRYSCTFREIIFKK